MTTIDNRQIGYNLRNARRLSGLTQREVADRASFSVNSLWNWENGKVSIDAKSLVEVMSIYADEYDDDVETPSLDDILCFRPARIELSGYSIPATARDVLEARIAAMPMTAQEV